MKKRDIRREDEKCKSDEKLHKISSGLSKTDQLLSCYREDAGLKNKFVNNFAGATGIRCRTAFSLGKITIHGVFGGHSC